MPKPEQQWRVPIRLEDVPDTGLHIDIVTDVGVRAHLAALAGVQEIIRLDVAIDVARHGQGLRATGWLTATVSQSCVITLEPLENRVEESVDVVFAPAPADQAAGGDATIGALADGDEPPELLVGGVADLGAILIEFLLLGIDPYPRAPGAVFAPPAEASDTAGPFDVLAKLKVPG